MLVMKKGRRTQHLLYSIVRHNVALIAILFILIAIALFFIVSTFSIWGWGSDQGFGDQGYTVTRVEGIQINMDDPLIDVTGSDAVVPIRNSPPRTLVEYLFVYLLFIGGPAGLYYAIPVLGRLEKKTILCNDNRNSIYKYIKANPGCTREDINKRLSINIGTVCHHVTALKLWGLIGYEENGKFKMIYSSEMMGRANRRTGLFAPTYETI